MTFKEQIQQGILIYYRNQNRLIPRLIMRQEKKFYHLMKKNLRFAMHFATLRQNIMLNSRIQRRTRHLRRIYMYRLRPDYEMRHVQSKNILENVKAKKQ
jgi:hypothetical protein